MSGSALSESHQRLNALAAINDAERYLEIGVAQGHTFTEIGVPLRVGVDPRFRFDIAAHANAQTHFHGLPSDRYFAEVADRYDPFDLIFIDGLHTFEQTFRDFCASLAHAHRRTLWVIDDTCPSGPLAAHPDVRVTVRWRQRLGIRDGQWMGDVFKVVFAIHDCFPQFSWATFPEHGQTVVWLETRRDFAPTWTSLARIGRLGYAGFLRHRAAHHNFMASEALLARVRAGLPVAP